MTKDAIAAVIAPYVSVFAGQQMGDFQLKKRKDEVVVENLEGKWKVTLCAQGKSVVSMSYGSGPLIMHVNRGRGLLYALFHDIVLRLSRGRIDLDDVPVDNVWMEFVRITADTPPDLLQQASQARDLALQEATRQGFEPGVVRVTPDDTGFLITEENLWRAKVRDGELVGWSGFPDSRRPWGKTSGSTRSDS